MTRLGKGRKGKGEKRKLHDGEINVAGIAPAAQRTRKDGGARVPAGYLAIYYEYPDGTIKAHKRTFEISPKRFVDCEDMIDVARVVKEFCGGLEHLKELELRFCKGDQFELQLGDFLDEFRGSNRTSPVEIFCRAPVGPVLGERVAASDSWQAFFQSAAKHYGEWEEDEAAACADSADVEKDGAMKFLTVSGDPLGNFKKGFLLGIRECYKDLKKILVDAEVRDRFVVLGTSGIGKSAFSIFWVCYLATMKKKVVWKVDDEFNLLDFSDEAAVAVCPPLGRGDPEIRKVLRDHDAWLILDGGHTGGFACDCRVLVPCSTQAKNHKEFCKNQTTSILYLPVWEEEEVSQFLDAFEKRRAEYPHMCVPSKEEAMKYFQELGGVARYVLCSKNTEVRLIELQGALAQLNAENCVKILQTDFEGLSTMRDVLLHMTCALSTNGKQGKYSEPVFQLATSGVKSKVIRIFDEKYKVDVVATLREIASCIAAGSLFGYMFELVGHFIFFRGGDFRMKEVYEDRPCDELGLVKLPKLRCCEFQSLENLPNLEAGTYYRPMARNLASIEAILHPRRLLQFFSYRRGVHGYLVKGLQDVHAQLKGDKYELWSCVPKEKYEDTGFQTWLTTNREKYKQKLPGFLEQSQQYVIEVDCEKFC